MKLADIYKQDLFIFDFDGTIADSLGLEFEIYSRYLKARGLAIKKSDWEKKLVYHTAEGYVKFMAEFFKIKLDYKTFKQDYAYYARQVENEKPIQPFKWFLKFLPKVKDKIKVILSNKDADLIVDNLVSWGVKDEIEKVYSCTTLRKTKSEILPQIIKDFKVDPNLIALFEDSQSCIDVAKNMGVTTIGIKNKVNQGKLKTADLFIDSTK